MLKDSDVDAERRRILLEHTKLNVLYAVNSCRSNKYTYNPLFLTIVKRQKQLFDVVAQACTALNTAYDVCLRDDEIALIASSFIPANTNGQERPQDSLLRVLVACVNGLGTARMLSARLKTVFPDILIVGTCSVQDLNMCDLIHDVDLIISTVHVEGFYSAPLIVSTPLLDDESIASISRVINMKRLYSLRTDSHNGILIDLICDIIDKNIGGSWNQETVRNEIKLILELAAKFNK